MSVSASSTATRKQVLIAPILPDYKDLIPHGIEAHVCDAGCATDHSGVGPGPPCLERFSDHLLVRHGTN